jgi:5-methylcytosine-specific restriction endonuclease McrA
MRKMSLFGEEKKRRPLTAFEKDIIRQRQKNRCAICKTSLEGLVVHYDHKKAIALGGSDTPRNLQALCPNCHAKKSREDRNKIAKAKRSEKGDIGTLIWGPKRTRKKRSIRII